jgi:hypothetical protein
MKTLSAIPPESMGHSAHIPGVFIPPFIRVLGDTSFVYHNVCSSKGWVSVFPLRQGRTAEALRSPSVAGPLNEKISRQQANDSVVHFISS